MGFCGEYLKMLRMKKGFTLRSLSDEISLSFTYLCDIENNKKTAPNDVALLQISRVLNLNEEEQIILFDIAANSKSLKDNAVSENCPSATCESII